MRWLALLHPGTNSRGLLLDMAAGLQQLGEEVLYFELQPFWSLVQSHPLQTNELNTHLAHLLTRFIQQNRIDASFGMWANGMLSLPVLVDPEERLVSWFDSIHHPHVQFWWDAPHWQDGGSLHSLLGRGLFNSPQQLHLINNRYTGAEMAEILDFSLVMHQPNGVNPDTFKPDPAVTPDYDLVIFSGGGDPNPTPLMLEELQKEEPDLQRIRRDQAARLGERIEQWCSKRDTSQQHGFRKLIHAMIEQRLANRHLPALLHLQQAAGQDVAVAQAAAELIRQPVPYIQLTELVRSIETWERPFMVAYLARYFRCLRVGAQDYSTWGLQGDTVASVPYDEQHRYYARARFALNVMRWQDDCSLNSKIFEITASRCGCLQGYRAGVEDLFEADREILIFHTPAEARQKLSATLALPDHGAAIAAAGYRRTLRDHTWAQRWRAVVPVISKMTQARPPAAQSAALPVQRITPEGDHLVFLLAPMRSGSTLLRKIIDSHPRLCSPAETWFLMPLINMWNGRGPGDGYDAAQAAAALQGLVNQDGFMVAARQFAAEVYNRLRSPEAQLLIDKTPFYLRIAQYLPMLFPRARYLLLLRDPRGTVWSFHTWEKITSPGIADISQRVARELMTQYDFQQAHPDSTAIIHYEELCANPEAACRRMCDFLQVPFEPSMMQYGRYRHHEGYGDEKSRLHAAPHQESVERWSQAGGISLDEQVALARGCGEQILRHFGYDQLADLAVTCDVP
ncbi:MAG: hypothetical protein HJJLKODD_01482 [Phycisphaerae bacterium]|nr:hypothetical protein [Phycisphaerae bacterium]